jgi:hypothetical protein
MERNRQMTHHMAVYECSPRPYLIRRMGWIWRFITQATTREESFSLKTTLITYESQILFCKHPIVLRLKLEISILFVGFKKMCWIQLLFIKMTNQRSALHDSPFLPFSIFLFLNYFFMAHSF